MSRRIWTEPEKQLLLELWPSTPIREIMQRLDRTDKSIYGQAGKMGLKRPLEFLKKEFGDNLRKIGAKSRFKKGQKPWSAGTKGILKGSKTSFKKGNIPHNAKDADGAISTRKDNSGKLYKYIRISLGKWELLHRHLWEQAHGPIPKGHVVKFKDGNQANCTLDNLYLCTQGENMLHNSIHHYPPELKQTIRTLGQLKKRIKHATEQNNRSSESPL